MSALNKEAADSGKTCISRTDRDTLTILAWLNIRRQIPDGKSRNRRKHPRHPQNFSSTTYPHQAKISREETYREASQM